MDSFVDTTDMMRMKRSYDRSLAEGEGSVNFGKTRHNLMQDFETPAKSIKLSEIGSSTMKRSFSSLATPSNNESIALKRQLRLKDAEIISLKATITQMENRASSLEVAARHARIDQEKEITKLKSEKDREATKCSEFRSKLHYVMEKEKSAREEIQRLEEELHKFKMETDRKLLDIQKDKLDVANKTQQAKAKWLDTEAELRNEIMSQMQEISSLHSKCAEAEEQLELMRKQRTESSAQTRELEELREELEEEKKKTKNLEQWLAEHEDNMVISKAMKADLDLVPSMKSELEKLRMDNEQLRHNEQNTLLLEEKIRSLKKKLETFDGVQERLTQLEVENEELQGRLHRWEASDTSGSRRPQSPCSLSQKINDLETSQANFLLKQGELQTNISSMQRQLEQAQGEKRKVMADCNNEKSTNAQLNDLVKRLKRKLLLVSKERDSYKNLLDSYESEVTLNFDAERKAQIQRLEGILQNYRDQAAVSEQEIESLSGKLAQAQSEIHKLQSTSVTVQQTTSAEDKETIRQLREQLVEVENNLIKVQEERDILEARIEQRQLQGDYDPSKTKIVHLINNPCSIAQKARQEELDKVKEENEKLRKRNEILEEHGGHVDDITIQVQEKLQQPSPSKEVEEMKAQLKREEMRNKRLMEVFKKTSQEFRETCYQLTGYKIDIPCANQYRLTSMYAESPRDYLLFQQNEQGEIQMLQTDFSTTLQDAMEMYLQRQHSIPMFLSHITMDLFSRQTMNLG